MTLALTPQETFNSNNFALSPAHPVEHLWDGCLDGTPECTSGGYVTSFWIEFDINQNHNLTTARLFGDADGTWLSNNWALKYKVNSEDSWITAFEGVDALLNGWSEQQLDILARYVRVEVFQLQDQHKQEN